MGKQTPRVEWLVAESDADWECLCPLTPPAVHRHRHWSRLYWGIGTLLLLLVGLGGWVWRMEQKVISQPPTKVTATMQPIPAALAQGRAILATTVISDIQAALPRTAQNNEPTAAWKVEFSELKFWDQRAVVSIVTGAKSEAPAYRQTLFYQRTAGGWVRMAPDATQWGAARSLATPYFVFHFRENDAATVRTVAPQMDALYTALRHNFGLPIIPSPEKLVLEVSVTERPGQIIPWFRAPDLFLVPSPAVYLAPVELTDAEILAQSLALPLLAAILAQASEHHALGSYWQPLVDGLRLWQVWEMNLPLASGREDVVTWLYRDLPAPRPGPPLMMPGRYRELCATYKLWLSSPLLINIPLVCAEPKWEGFLWSQWDPRNPLTRLDQIAVPVLPHEYMGASSLTDSVSYPGQAVMLATLIEYAVATYGRERLPTLVAGLGQHENWATLIPAVYGVPAPEFEAGWQAYLATHYGVSLETLLHQ